MDIKTSKEESDIIIEIAGELDASSAIQLDQEINKALLENEKAILVDCTRLEYISSAGLGVFMSYLQELQEKDTKMVLFGLSEKVLNVFRILGLDTLISISSSKESAQELVK